MSYTEGRGQPQKNRRSSTATRNLIKTKFRRKVKPKPRLYQSCAIGHTPNLYQTFVGRPPDHIPRREFCLYFVTYSSDLNVKNVPDNGFVQ